MTDRSLVKTFDAGPLESSEAVAELRGDPDLAPLRSRPDFELLLMDVAMPIAPFARRD